MSCDVFISYARSTSRRVAESLWHALMASGREAFLDSVEIEAGHEFPSVLSEAVLDARVFVVFADPVYFKRWYCLRELRLALASFETLVVHGADESQRSRALDHVVVALPVATAVDDCLDRLPPGLATVNWPLADATAALARAVADRLERIPWSIRQLHDETNVPREHVNAFTAASRMPSAAPLAGIPMYPLDLPPSLNDDFVGRADELWELDYALSSLRGQPSATAALTGVLASGAGFGKTRLALEYLHRRGRARFPGGLFWVDAGKSLDSLDEQFHGIWRALDPARHRRSLKDFRDAGQDMCDALAEGLHRAPDRDPILFIVDNVPEARGDASPQPLSTWCPAVGRVTVLATSRSHALSDLLGVHPLTLDVLATGAAVELLTRHVPYRRVASEVWANIARAVGNLPLALELLNAALRQGVRTPHDISERVTSTGITRALDEAMRALRGKVPEGALRGVSEALMISYESLPDDAQVAARRLAFFGPETIPLALGITACSVGARADVHADLMSHSILTPSQDRDSAPAAALGRMHRVMADFLRLQGKDTSDIHYALRALRSVLTRKPPSEDRELAHSLLPHVAAALGHLQATGSDNARNAPLLTSMAGVLADFGAQVGTSAALRLAIALSKEALNHCHEERGSGWIDARNQLGLALSALGRSGGGTIYLEGAIATFRATLDELDSDAGVPNRSANDAWRAGVKTNLGVALANLGERRMEARTIREAVLLLREGRNALAKRGSPDQVLVEKALAFSLVCLSKLDPEREHLRGAVALYTSLLTRVDPAKDTEGYALTLNDFGLALQLMVKFDQATEAFRTALEWIPRETAPVRWAMIMRNLADSLRLSGEFHERVDLVAESLSVYDRALDEYDRLGRSDDWAATRSNQGAAMTGLGLLERSADRLEGAVRALREALQKLPKAHAHDWATTQDFLGLALVALGDLRDDCDLLEQAVGRFRDALRERRRESAPLAWAATKSHLGEALLLLAERERSTFRLERAIIALYEALTELPPEFAREHRRTQQLLTRAQALLVARTKR